MADKLGVANLYGVATLDASGQIVLYVSASLSAEAIVSAAQGSAYGIAALETSAIVVSHLAGIRSASTHPLVGQASLSIVSFKLNNNAPSESHLSGDASVYGIANVSSTIEEAECHLASEATLAIEFHITTYNSAHLFIGNCYSPGYYTEDYVGCDNVKATGYLAVYGACTLNSTDATVSSLITMDWTRNNTWRISEICRIQQQLLTAVLDIAKKGNDHLISDDVQPLFEKYDKLIYEVQNV